MQIAASCWPECEPVPVLLVPVGSTEQHGPHLPLGTDTVVATTVAERAGLPVAPAVAFGASGEHETFPGTVSVGTESLASVLVELGRSAGRWVRRLVFVNGHGGNVDALRAAVALLRSESRDAAWFACAPAGGDAHAGRTETSIMLAVSPETVRFDQAQPGATEPVEALLPAIREGSVADVSPSGVLGDPTGASAAEGAEAVAVMVASLRGAVERWSVDPSTGRLR